MKKTRLLKKDLEKLAQQKSGMQGVVEGDYRKEDVYATWSLFSDSARRSVFYVTDPKVITQINEINTKILYNELLNKKSDSQSVSNDSILNAFEILWNLSNAAQLDDSKLDLELAEIARKMEPGTHLLRIKDEFIGPIPKIIEGSLNGAFEGHKVVLPQGLYSTFFPERLLKTWEDFEIALAMMLENLLLRAHLDRLTHIYKEHVEEAFKEFEGIAQPEAPAKRKKHKKKRRKAKAEVSIVPIQQPVGNSIDMKSILRIQRWWKKRRTIINLKVKLIEEKDLKPNLLIEIQEEDFEDTEKSSVQDSEEEMLSEKTPNPVMQMLTSQDYDLDDSEELIHTRKRKKNEEDEDLEIEKILQREYCLCEQRLYKNTIEQYQQKTDHPWPFYPVVNEYYAYTGIAQRENFAYPWPSVIMPYGHEREEMSQERESFDLPSFN